MPRKRISGEKSFALPESFKVTAGIDTDRDFLVTAIIDHEGSVPSSPSNDGRQVITREFAQDHVGIAKLCEHLKDNAVEYVVIESTGAYHIAAYQAMKAHGIRVGVINPQFIRSLLRVEGKTDAADAVTLARLASGFHLRISNMPDEMQTHLRLYLRTYDKTSSHKTRISNQTVNLLTQQGILLYRLIKIGSVSGMAILFALSMGEPPQEAVKKNWKGAKKRLPELLDSVNDLPEYMLPFLGEAYADMQQAKMRMDHLIDEALKLSELYGLQEQMARMSTAPAIKPLLALRIISEMGHDFSSRYYSADAFASACGVAPKNIITGGQLVKKGTARGNSHVKKHVLNSVKGWLLSAPDHHPLKQWFVSYQGRGGTYSKGCSALARKIICALWWMEKRAEFYQPN